MCHSFLFIQNYVLFKKTEKTQLPEIMDKSFWFYYCSLSIFYGNKLQPLCLKSSIKIWSQTKKTCFVLSLLLIALAAVITRLWTLGSCWAQWRLFLRQKFLGLEEETSACTEFSREGFCRMLPWRIKELLSTGSFSGALFWKHKNGLSSLR